MKPRIYSDPNCEKCEGRGMYLHPETGGAVHCDCHNRVRIIEMTGKAMFPSQYLGCTVGGYQPKTPQEIENRKTVIEWVNGYKRGCNGLAFAGPTGNGKTHLLVAIGKALIIQHSVQPLFTTAANFIRETKARFDGGAERLDKQEQAESVFDTMAEAKVLLLDDLGAERQTEFSVDLICNLLDNRYSEGRTTLVSTNFTVKEIRKTYGERFEDRLFEMCKLVLVDGESRRRKEGAA